MRAALAKYEVGAQLSDQVIYPNTSVDDSGDQLTGEHRYVLHFDADKLPPVSVFWNLALYGSDMLFVENDFGRYSFGSTTDGLQQVLLNFTMNACEAMSATALDGRVLTVTTATHDHQSVEICVVDTDKGISPEVRGHLFEAFATTKKDGLGLGLSICRSIISAHGGRQWAENRAEGGAAFHISLPAHRPECERASQIPSTN